MSPPIPTLAPGRARPAAWAAAALGLAGAGSALVANAGDAVFLARVGAQHLGAAFAISSALLVVVLGVLGALADRTDRGRLIARVGLAGAVALGALAAGFEAAPGLASAAALVLGKQLSAGFDLAFWVLVAERFDARRARKLVPVLVAVHGGGIAAGAFAVDPIAGAFGAVAALAAGAALFGGAAIVAWRFSVAGGAGPLPRTRARGRRIASLRAGWLATRHSGLALRLAAVVGVAGTFAPILYYLLGASAAGALGDEAAIASFLGRYRGVVQLLTLAAQALLTPALLSRAGVAPSLLVAPIGAVAAAVALAAYPQLAVIVIAQGSARLLDTAVQTPAEKLVQNLIARELRGRVAGFLDGVAKRAGAIAGGLAVSVLYAWPAALFSATIAIALGWLAAAYLLWRRFPDLAVRELSLSRVPEQGRGDHELEGTLTDPRSLSRLRQRLAAGGDGLELAADLVVRLGEHGRLDPAAELAAAAARAGPRDRAVLVRALDGALQEGAMPGAGAEGPLCEMLGAGEVPRRERAVAARALGLIGSKRARVELADAARREPQGALGVAVFAALAVFDEEPAGRIEVLEEGLAGDEEERWEAAADLRGEVARRIGKAAQGKGEGKGGGRQRDAGPAGLPSTLAACARLLHRSARRGDPPSLEALAALFSLADRAEIASAELSLARASANELAARLCAAGGGAGLAPVRLLAAVGERAEAHLLARALGDADEEVRRVAAAGLRRLGPAALEALLVAASFGRRSARNGAIELLRDLPVSREVLDDLVDRELTEICETAARLGPITALERAALAVRRLEERISEAAHTMLLGLEARLERPAIGAAARRLLRSRDPLSRARALEALDSVLPRSILRRLLPALEPGPAGERSERAAALLGRALESPSDAASAEIRGDDPLARAFLVHAVGASGRAAFRDSIAAAAERAVRSANPLDVVSRIAGSEPDTGSLEDEMPRSVETLMHLSQVSLFSDLSTRQLSELAEAVRWQSAAAGDVIVAEGEPGDAMYFVYAGEVRVETALDGGGARLLAELGPGEPFGEMSLFDDQPRSATVLAKTRVRLGRIDRPAFEELVEEIPGIALALCRVLSRRLTRVSDPVR